MAVCGFVVCRRHRLGFREGFAVRPVSLATLVWNVATGILAASAATALVLHFAPKEPATAQAAVTPAATALFCVMMLTVPVAEELYYRGFVYGVLARRLRPLVAIPLIAFWFGLAHLAQTQGLLALVPFPFIMGAVLAWFRHRSGSTIASFACHWAYNATLVAAALAGTTRCPCARARRACRRRPCTRRWRLPSGPRWCGSRPPSSRRTRT